MTFIDAHPYAITLGFIVVSLVIIFVLKRVTRRDDVRKDTVDPDV
jgi:hypothetical protein